MTPYIYVASSWRNTQQPAVVAALRRFGYVYDFRHPTETNDGFSWAEIDPAWKTWDEGDFIEALQHPRADEGFAYDMRALEKADICVLLLPSGKSAHLEAGYVAGHNSGAVIIVLEAGAKPEPELMYKMGHIVIGLNGLIAHMEFWAAEAGWEKPLW